MYNLATASPCSVTKTPDCRCCPECGNQINDVHCVPYIAIQEGTERGRGVARVFFEFSVAANPLGPRRPGEYRRPDDAGRFFPGNVSGRSGSRSSALIHVRRPPDELHEAWQALRGLIGKIVVTPRGEARRARGDAVWRCSDSRHPAPLMLILSCAENAPSAILR